MTPPPALLAALGLALAFAAPARAQQPETEAGLEEELPLFPAAPAAPPAGVRKITDGTLGCEQILAESRSLEAAIAQHRAASEAAQRDAGAAQDTVMQQAGGSAAMPIASSLLGMLPGGGMVSGIAAQAALSAQRSAMQQGATRMTAAYQRMAQAQEQMAYAQARNDHLVGLFLQKKCPVPQDAAPQ